MKNLIPCFVIFLICFASCKKDHVFKKEDNCPGPQPDYYPMKVGNYWIYEQTNLDTNGLETVTGIDSAYVEKDTLINGNTYKKIHGSLITGYGGVSLLRDSSDCVITTNGNIIFSNSNFEDTLFIFNTPGYFDGYYKMDPVQVVISVPAGNYLTRDYLGTFHFLSPGYPWENPRHTHVYYAAGVGMVREISMFSAAPGYITRRLLRYHLE